MLKEEVLLEKCPGRRICSQCGGNFNVASINMKGENGSPGTVMAPLLPPAHCMSKLIIRSDDTEAVVKERLQIYNEMGSRVSQWRNFIVGEENYWCLTCQEESQKLGQSYLMPLILMIMNRSSLLQHKMSRCTIKTDFLTFFFFAFMHILHAWQFFRKKNQRSWNSLLVLFEITNNGIRKCHILVKLMPCWGFHFLFVRLSIVGALVLYNFFATISF